MRAAALSLFAAFSTWGAASAEDVTGPRAAPSALVAAAPLASVSERPRAPADPLDALLITTDALDTEAADTLLRDAYDAYPTATARSRAFALAAAAASSDGDHQLALAWTDWAIGQAEATPERDALLAERLREGVGIALAAGNPVLARSYVRRAGAIAVGWRDDPAGRGVRSEALGLYCPDVIDDRFIRVETAADAPGGRVATGAARCRYVPLVATVSVELVLQATPSWLDAEDKTRGLMETGLGVGDADVRRAVAARLPERLTALDPIRVGGAPAFLAYVRHTRLGVDEAASFAYAAARREGVYTAARVEGPVRDWPPEALGADAAAALAAALGGAS
jgi:hypothetical protein